MSLNKNKTDPDLGWMVHNYLINKGVQTPYNANAHQLSIKDTIDIIQTKFADIMEAMGLDLNDDSLKETPKRVAKMFMNEIFWGLYPSNFPKIKIVENNMNYDEMIIEKNIKLYSDCEHHFRPIVGNATIAYIPNNKILGLSKIPRICEYFARRPQLQERMAVQIFYALEYILETSNIAISIQGEHLCVSQRGVEDTSANTITHKLGGVFKSKPATRNEFFALVYGESLK